MKKDNLLRVQDLSVTYQGNQVFKPISFNIQKGDIVAVIGPNGSGKTTLVKALIGELSFSGSAKWKDDVIVGYVPQRFQLPGHIPLTVIEFLLAFVKTKREKEEIYTILPEVGLEKKEKSFVYTLSGGEMQRLLIAKALIRNPDFLILDEPVSGVDIEGERNFYDIISHLHSSHHTTIMMVSHEIEVVSSLADTVICLSKNYACFGPTKKTLSKDTLSRLFGTDVSLHKHDHSH